MAPSEEALTKFPKIKDTPRKQIRPPIASLQAGRLRSDAI